MKHIWKTGLLLLMLVLLTIPCAQARDYKDLWMHTWERVGEKETQLVVTDNGDGTLHMEMYFFRMIGGIQADFVPDSAKSIHFTDSEGEFEGSIAFEPEKDGYLHLYINGGNAMKDPEGLFYEYFTQNEFIFTTHPLPDPKDYADDGQKETENAGQTLADDDVVTIVNLGKQTNIIRDVTDVGSSYPVYRLSVTNHLNRTIRLYEATKDDPGKYGSVDGAALGYLDLYLDNDDDRPDHPAIAAGETAEVIASLNGHGYGYASADELVNVVLYIHVEAQDLQRDYQLLLDQGKTYPRREMTGYVAREAASLGIAFELPDDWKIRYSTDLGDMSSLPAGYAMNEGEWLALMPPPTLEQDGIQMHLSPGTLDDYTHVADSALKIGGRPTKVYTTDFQPPSTHYLVALEDDLVLEIIVLPYGDDDAAMMMHILNSIRFTGAVPRVSVTQAPQQPDDPGEVDWIGHWLILGGDYESHIIITRGVLGDLDTQISFDNRYFFNGALDGVGDDLMEFYTDDFNALLLLDRQKRTITMSDIGAMVDEVNDWLDVFHFKPVYEWAGTDTPAPTPAKKTQPTTAPNTAGLIPIPGKSRYMQVPVDSVDATSYIVSSKDPTAYIPERMIDGDEETAFQFSTKKTKLGKEYLYFYFDSPVTLDEMWMKNGFWKITNGLDQYTRNSRPKKITIHVRYAGSSKYQNLKSTGLKDDKARKDWKVIDMLGVKNVTAVRIRIDEIFKGTKFPNDVCVSEIMFVRNVGK